MKQRIFNMSVIVACITNVILMVFNMEYAIVPRFHVLYELIFIWFFSSLSMMTLTGFNIIILKSNSVIVTVCSIPLYPLILLAKMSKSKLFSVFSFPLTILIVLLPLVSFSSEFICTIIFKTSSNVFIVPYLNLTIGLLLFSYGEKYMLSYLKSMPVSRTIPAANQDYFTTINNNRFFLKISFWFLAVFSTLSSIEKFSNTSILIFNQNYRAIFFESLLTLVAFDRAFDKSRNNSL